jgi:myo-inositol-1(or 4)-monophosphatase
MEDERTRVAVAERAARAGGAVARDAFRDDIDVETKDGKTDVVTWADRRSQERVVEIVGGVYPDDAIVGEEDEVAKSVPEAGPAWIVDPIDGTNNFVRDDPIWATSVAAVVDGEPVAAANVMPAIEDAYVAGPDGVTRNGRSVSVSDVADPELCTVGLTMWWGRDRRDEYADACRSVVERFDDLRRIGSAQAALSQVAAGSLDGVLTNVDAHPWDSIAGAFAIEQAGGTVTGLDGERWRHDSHGLVASNGACHDAVLEAARSITGD